MFTHKLSTAQGTIQ